MARASSTAAAFATCASRRGWSDILIYVGGNLVVGKQTWAEVEQRFLDMGFDRAFPPGTRTDDVIRILAQDFAARAQDSSTQR